MEKAVGFTVIVDKAGRPIAGRVVENMVSSNLSQRISTRPDYPQFVVLQGRVAAEKIGRFFPQGGINIDYIDDAQTLPF